MIGFTRDGRHLLLGAGDALNVVELDGDGDERSIAAPGLRGFAAFDDEVWIAAGPGPTLTRHDLAGTVRGAPLALSPPADDVEGAGRPLVGAPFGDPAALWLGRPCLSLRLDGSAIVAAPFSPPSQPPVPLAPDRRVELREAGLYLVEGAAQTHLRAGDEQVGARIVDGAAVLEERSVALLVERGGSRTLVVLATRDGAVQHRLPQGDVRRAAFAPKRGHVVLQEGDRRLSIVDLRFGKTLKTWEEPQPVLDLGVDTGARHLVVVRVGADGGTETFHGSYREILGAPPPRPVRAPPETAAPRFRAAREDAPAPDEAADAGPDTDEALAARDDEATRSDATGGDAQAGANSGGTMADRGEPEGDAGADEAAPDPDVDEAAPVAPTGARSAPRFAFAGSRGLPRPAPTARPSPPVSSSPGSPGSPAPSTGEPAPRPRIPFPRAAPRPAAEAKSPAARPGIADGAAARPSSLRARLERPPPAARAPLRAEPDDLATPNVGARPAPPRAGDEADRTRQEPAADRPRAEVVRGAAATGRARAAPTPSSAPGARPPRAPDLAALPLAGDLREALREAARDAGARLLLHGAPASDRRAVLEALAAENGRALARVDLSRLPSSPAPFRRALARALRACDPERFIPCLVRFDLLHEDPIRSDLLRDEIDSYTGRLFALGRDDEPATRCLAAHARLLPGPTFSERVEQAERLLRAVAGPLDLAEPLAALDVGERAMAAALLRLDGSAPTGPDDPRAALEAERAARLAGIATRDEAPPLEAARTLSAAVVSEVDAFAERAGESDRVVARTDVEGGDRAAWARLVAQRLDRPLYRVSAPRLLAGRDDVVAARCLALVEQARVGDVVLLLEALAPPAACGRSERALTARLAWLFERLRAVCLVDVAGEGELTEPLAGLVERLSSR